MDGLTLFKNHFVGPLHVTDTLPVWPKTPELQSESLPSWVEGGRSGNGGWDVSWGGGGQMMGRGVWRTTGLSPALTCATT